MPPLKVLNITSTRYGIGGVERLLLDMADKYDATQFEISYCNLFCEKNGNGVFPSEIKRRGLGYFNIPGNRLRDVPAMLYRLIRLLRKERFDIVHLHMAKATILGWAASRFVKVPLVATRHYTYKLIAKYPAILRYLESAATRSIDRIIAISEYVKNDMVSAGLPAEKMIVIHNGIEIEVLDEAGSESELHKPRTEGPIIGTVGSLTPRKGHKYLITAFAQVAESYPDARLLIFGEGPERASLEALVTSLSIEKNVDLLGFVENVPVALLSIDLYVHPAIDEPFGIAVLEAMAAKKPIIATAVDGVTEIIRDGETGFLVAPGSAAAITDAILDVLSGRSGLKEMSERARSDVEARFDIKNTVEAYEDVYRTLAGN
jgi:glycosyltransferase involved in cell wall biosynthesis